MKNRRVSWLGILVLGLLVISLLAMFGCSTKTTTTAAPVTVTATTTAVATTTATATATAAPVTVIATPPPPKILKIGLVAWLGWPLGIDMVHGIQLMTERVNKSGGLKIGGDTYQIQTIVYDNNNSQTTAVSAVNKLVFEDKVKFICSDVFFVDAWLPITEANKVVVCAGTSVPSIFDSKIHYAFQTGFINCFSAQMTGWIAKNYPNVKNVVVGLPDTQDGHNYLTSYMAQGSIYKFNVTPIFYPPTATDLSALGTKVKQLNPDAFEAAAGGPIAASLALKAAYQAGYSGIRILSATVPAMTLTSILPPDAFNNFVVAAYPVEFDPALTQAGKDFKADYIAKYGKWDGPEVSFTADWACLSTALQQAGTLDPDAVAKIISGGLKFEGPTGPAQMVSRMDMGNSKTVDSVTTYYVKKVVDGKPVLIDTVNIDDAVANFNKVFNK
jgi:branched-chain amino acid transport system substrate-binding protein